MIHRTGRLQDAPEPAALAGGERDLPGYSRQFGLKGADQRRLTRACERLGTDAARVDGITPDSTRHALSEEVTRLQSPPPGAEPLKPARPAPARRLATH